MTSPVHVRFAKGLLAVFPLAFSVPSPSFDFPPPRGDAVARQPGLVRRDHTRDLFMIGTSAIQHRRDSRASPTADANGALVVGGDHVRANVINLRASRGVHLQNGWLNGDQIFLFGLHGR